MLDSRKSAILEAVIEEHLETALPVGSKALAGGGGFDVSAATIRNAMNELEADGYLTHPHTSAGRIPTEKAYRHYARQYLAEPPPLAERTRRVLGARIAAAEEQRQQVKELAKAVAECAELAVLVGFTPRDVYYTGLSYLFAQPEFAEREEVVHLSALLDHLDEVMERLTDAISADCAVAVGSENPFGRATSVVLARGTDGAMLFALLGPLRMHYGRNIALARYAHDYLCSSEANNE